MVKTIYSWKPISKRPTGRPKIRWEDDVKKDIQRLKGPNWKTLVHDRRRWKWLRRPKHCNRSCRTVLRKKKKNTRTDRRCQNGKLIQQNDRV